MKFRILFLLGAMIVAGMAAVVAQADGLPDPKIIINKGGDATPYDGSAPITEAFDPGGFSLDFAYTGTTDLDSLTVDLTNVPFGEAFQCFSDIWVECNIGIVQGDPLTVVLTFDDNYHGAPDGTPGPCQNNTPAGGICPGFLTPPVNGVPETFSITLNTPEPSSMLLLGAGMVPLFFFGRKRWALNNPAA
jgi:hypothetical protein